MMEGIAICSVCTSRETQCVCICKFPLLGLCSFSECAELHTRMNSGIFHYLLPTTARNCVTARSHSDSVRRVTRLHRLQSKLLSSLDVLDTAVAIIEEFFQREVATLTTLRDQYVARVSQLKEAAADAFNRAISETAQNALSIEYTPQSDIAQWIWTMANNAEDDDDPLFQSEVRGNRTEGVESLLHVKVSSVFPSLATWSFHPPTSGKTTEVERLKSTIAALEQRAERSEGDVKSLTEELERWRKRPEKHSAEAGERAFSTSSSAIPKASSRDSESFNQPAHTRPQPTSPDQPRRSERLTTSKERPQSARASFFQGSPPLSLPNNTCKTCGVPVNSSKESSRCVNTCQCATCWVQTVFAPRSSGSCPYCGVIFNRQEMTYMRGVKALCHVCGLVVNAEEIARKAKCRVCIHCVVSTIHRRFLLADKTVGTCPLCKGAQFTLKQKEASERPLRRACCGSEELASVPLACGHYACRTHIKWLKQCRACHRPAEFGGK